MADKKISALPSATTPLAGSEVLPIVQGGTTDKVSVANLTAGRTVSAANMSLSVTSGTCRIQMASPDSGGSNLLIDTDGSGATFNMANGLPMAFKTANTEAFRVDTNQNIVIATAGKGIDFSANANAPGMTSELLTWYEEGTWTPTYIGWTTNPTSVFAKYTRIGRVVIINYTGENGISVAGVSEIDGLPFTSNSQQGASVAMKDISGSSPGVTAFGSVGANATKIGAMTSATFTGLYWSFTATYIV